MKKYVKPTSDVVKIESKSVLCTSDYIEEGETETIGVYNQPGDGTYL